MKKEATMGEKQPELQKQQRQGLRLVLFPLPFKGHINPMLQLAAILHSNGFPISILHTTFNSPTPSDHPHFDFHPISVDGLSETDSPTPDLVDLLELLNQRCAAPFRDCLEKLTSEEPVACLISDAIMHCTATVADSLRIPRIVLRTGGVASFLAFASFPLLLDKGYLPIQESRLEEAVPELPPLRIKDLPVINTGKPEALYHLLAEMIKTAKNSSGLIWNTFDELEQPELSKLRREFPIPIFPIGPFHKHLLLTSTHEDRSSSISWLQNQPPSSVIYVSFGTIASMEESQFTEIAHGLADSLHPFLWVVRPGIIRGSEWLKNLPDGFLERLEGRGKIVKWAPQAEVLAHPAVGAFWTHSGWNSTVESISEGIPMICMPCFTDQLVNARYVSHVWGVGLTLEGGIERGKIERVMRRVMGEEGKEMRKRILCMKERVNVCLRKGGSSHQSLHNLVSYISSL